MKKQLLMALIGLMIAGGSVLAQPGPLGEVTISYTFHPLTQIASNQLAVWIETPQGKYVATVFATHFMAKRQGYLQRPQTCPEWVKVVKDNKLSPADLDAVSGATQPAGKFALKWNGLDAKGNPVPAGDYLYKIEGNIAWENRVLWTGRIKLGTVADRNKAVVRYLPESAKDLGALVTDVEAVFQPK